MYQAIDLFYEQNKDVLFTTLKPSKSVVKDVENCFDNFKSYWAKGHSVVAKENVPDVIGKNVDENTRNQNIRVMQEFGYIVSNDGRNDYSFTKTFIDLCKSSQPLGLVVLDALYAIDGLDGLTMYLNYLLCTLREAYTFGNVVLFPDSKEKFSRLVPDKNIRDKYRKRVYDFYGFIGDTRQRPNPLTTDEYTPNASYMSRTELENLKLLEKGNKENGLDTLVLTTNGHHLLQQIEENLSHNSKIRTHMNLTPSTYIKKIDPIIFYGAPGTGKTSYVQNNIFNCYHPDNRFFLTFHQSFSYEEFVEGLKPVLDNTSKDVKYHIEKGVFYKACERAAIMAGYNNLKDCLNDSVGGRKIKFDAAISERKTIVLCIDEINRGNVASIFGDLISLIEPSKRLGAGVFEMTAILPYSQEEFGVPANLFIVGTMNTADRSIQLLDSALRRRFKFEELLPSYQNFKNQDAALILQKINANIRCLLNKDSQIGHSYLMNATSSKEILSVVYHKIIPLLEEYFYDDLNKVRFILNENDNTTYPFYIKDNVAKEAYSNYINQSDIEDEDREFYILNPDIEDFLKMDTDDDELVALINEKCSKYLLHLLGEKEDVETIQSAIEDDDSVVEVSDEKAKNQRKETLISIQIPNKPIINSSDSTQFDAFVKALDYIGIDKIKSFAALLKYKRLDCPVISTQKYEGIINNNKGYSYYQQGDLFIVKGCKNYTYIRILEDLDKLLKIGLSLVTK